jgi:putative ABC transport system permease protein
MSLIEVLRTAVESLAANKLRTALTMLGVIIGVGSVVALLSLGAGVRQFIGGQLKNLGTNLIAVLPSEAPNARLTSDDVDILSDAARLRGVVSVAGEVSDVVEAASETARQSITVAGSPPVFQRQNGVRLLVGRWTTQADEETRARVAVLGSTVARQLFRGQPSAALGQTVLINGAAFTVIGVAAPKGGLSVGIDDALRVPLTVAQEKLFSGRPGGARALSTITVEMATGSDMPAASRAITRLLREARNTQPGQKDAFRLFEPTSLISSFNTISTALTAFLGTIGAISLLVGGIGIMNIMLVSVTERTREIGVRKAIGASPASIRVQFLTEALTVTCLAGVLGIALGAGTSTLIGVVQSQFKPVIEFSAIATAFGISALIGVVFGFYPAYRASKLQPVEALRYE